MQAPSIEMVVALYQFAILLFSLSAHQCAQAWMASRMGDQTARLEGRISLNPTRHIDTLGTLVYPGLMLFGPLIGFTWFGNGSIVLGWGKPTPIITRNLQKITRDDNLITIAGPVANLFLVLVGFVLLVVLIVAVPGGSSAEQTGSESALAVATTVPQALALLGLLIIRVNLSLIFFNLLPIPPLDASRVVRNLLPYNALGTFDQIGRYSFIIIFFLGRIVVDIFLDPALRLITGALGLFVRGH